MKKSSTSNSFGKVILIILFGFIALVSIIAFFMPDYIPVEDMTKQGKLEHYSDLLEIDVNQEYSNLKIDTIRDVSYQMIARIRKNEPNLYNNYKRLAVNVITDKVQTKEELAPQLKRMLVDILIEHNDLNALKFLVFNKGENTSFINATFAPNGNWSDANLEDVTIYDFKFVMN